MSIRFTESTKYGFRVGLDPFKAISTVRVSCIYSVGRNGAIVPCLEEKYKYMIWLYNYSK